AIAAPDHRWPRRGALRPADLAEAPLILYERGGTIRRVIDAWFQRAGVRPRVAMELGNVEATKRLVAAGPGGSAIPAGAGRAALGGGPRAAGALAPPLARRLAIVRRRDKPATPALDAVLAALDGVASA